MKTITNTLLIATILTSNIIASEACTGDKCFASFAKKVAYEVKSTFKQTIQIKREDISTLTTESASTEVNEVIMTEADVNPINTIDEYLEYSDETTITNTNIEVVDSTYTETIIPETLKQENIKISINTRTETICKDGQDLVSCDIVSSSTECTCV